MGSDAAFSIEFEDRMRQAKGLPPKLLPIPPLVRAPIAIEREYRTLLLEISREVTSAVNEQIVPRLEAWHREAVRVDHADVAEYITELDSVLSSIQLNLGLIKQSDPIARRIGQAVMVNNGAGTQRQFKKVLGVDFVVTGEKVAANVEAFVRDNVDLIELIPRGHIPRVRNAVLRGLRGGQTVEQIASEITRLTRANEVQAARIARDQVEKLNGELNRVHQVNAGVKEYIWRTQRDLKVRDIHAAREGKVFKWSRPPIDGNPGQPINCRCVAEPNFQALNPRKKEARTRRRLGPRKRKFKRTSR